MYVSYLCCLLSIMLFPACDCVLCRRGNRALVWTYQERVESTWRAKVSVVWRIFSTRGLVCLYVRKRNGSGNGFWETDTVPNRSVPRNGARGREKKRKETGTFRPAAFGVPWIELRQKAVTNILHSLEILPWICKQANTWAKSCQKHLEWLSIGTWILMGLVCRCKSDGCVI